jgi:hypothetical protein
VSTPATLKQTRKLLSLFGDDPSTEDVQNVLSNGDLIQKMLTADLSKVDRDQFAAALRPPMPRLNYTPVADLVDRIMERSSLRGWGFTKRHAVELHVQLAERDHIGPLAPVSVRIWRGRDLAYNWGESLVWLEDEVKAQGLEYHQYAYSVPTFYPGSEIKGRHSLTAVGLGFSFWNSENGFFPHQVRPKQACWSSLEVPDFLCLNPQLLHFMNGKTFPFLMSAGLVEGSNNVPFFYRDDERGFFILADSFDDRWQSAAMVHVHEL